MTTLIDRRANVGLDPGVIGAGRFTALSNQLRGRGAKSNTNGRFEKHMHLLFDDGWNTLEDLPTLKTTVFEEHPKQIITKNDSPDIAFDRSINPYRGCEHGCSYCYARPTHAYMGLSPGLDFESKLFAKVDAAAHLREELSKPDYQPRALALGANTDPYQPIERNYRITRQVLETLLEFGHPAGIVTKSASVLRDIDVLKAMAERNLIKVALSITTLDPKLSRSMEPRASTPAKRLAAMEALSVVGIPTVVMVAPVIPGLNDSEIETILKAAAAAGAKEAGYVLLRLPLEVKDIFREWLMKEMPDRASRILSLIKQTRQGKENDATFGRRMVGTGPIAWSIGRRFEMACTRLGLNREKVKLSTDQFKKTLRSGEQLSLL